MESDYCDYYRGAAERFDQTRLDRGEDIDATIALLEEELAPPARVVDVGCGTGRYGRALQSRGYSVIGVDVSPHQLAHAHGLGETICASAEELPLPDGCVDVWVAILMLQQLEETARRRALAEAKRVLRPGGELLVKSCSDADPEARWVEAFFPSALALNKARYPSIEELIEELEALGFEEIQVKRTRTDTVIPSAELISVVSSKHNTTLGLLPGAEFEEGLARLKAQLTSDDAVVPQWHTHVISRRPV